MPPISTNLANKGYVTDELIQHYGARAKGGVGLIVSEVVTVEPTYVYLPGDMSIYDDSFIEGWKKLFDEVHKYGTILLPHIVVDYKTLAREHHGRDGHYCNTRCTNAGAAAVA